MTIGAGGAITVQSDPRAELRELLLKARAPLEAVGLALHGRRDAARVSARRRRGARRPIERRSAPRRTARRSANFDDFFASGTAATVLSSTASSAVQSGSTDRRAKR